MGVRNLDVYMPKHDYLRPGEEGIKVAINYLDYKTESDVSRPLIGNYEETLHEMSNSVLTPKY